MLIDINENHVVSFSGGRTSGYMVHLFEEAKRRYGVKVEYIFNDTGAEHPKTYEFIRNVVSHYNINLTCLRVVTNKEKGIGSSFKIIPLSECKPDLVPFKEVCEAYNTPSVKAATCTREMKLVPSQKYLKEKYKNDYTTWLGIRLDEPNRLKNIDIQRELFIDENKKKKRKTKYKVKYLAEISEFEKQDVLNFWANQPFDLDLEEHLGNCVFCVKKGINKIALATRDEPKLAKQFSSMIASDSIKDRVSKKGVVDKNAMYRGQDY